MNRDLHLFAPIVFRISSSRAASTDENVSWRVVWDEEAGSRDHGPQRVVMGTLTAEGGTGRGEVTVAGFVRGFDPSIYEDPDAEIGSSEAIETLYDVARSHITGVLGIIGVEVAIPRQSPQAEVHRITPPDATSSE